MARYQFADDPRDCPAHWEWQEAALAKIADTAKALNAAIREAQACGVSFDFHMEPVEDMPATALKLLAQVEAREDV